MTRSPLFYPLNRGMDSDAGGAAELQTDVMRFMAIISLCLVAIFALVQSMPMMPTLPPVTEPVSAEPVNEQSVAETEPVPEPVPVETRSAEPDPVKPVTVKPITVKPVPPPRAEPETIAEPAPTPKQTPPARDPDVEGFTLRFENDTALTRLVASDAIGLYAIAPDKTQKMQSAYGRIGFTAASTPQQFHEMEKSTVPGSVLQAFRRTGSLPPSAVKWGVTLSSNMTRSLNRILGERKGGNLVIHADGTLKVGN